MVIYDWYDKERNLVVAKSNDDYKIRQEETGAEYDEAIDLFDHYNQDNKPVGRFHYTETDKKIEEIT